MSVLPLLNFTIPAYSADRVQRTLAHAKKWWDERSFYHYSPESKKGVQQWLFLNTIQHLYRTLQAHRNLNEVVVCGYVHNDGLGDYYNMVEVADIVSQLYPKARMTIVAEFRDGIARGKSLTLPKKFTALTDQYRVIHIDHDPQIDGSNVTEALKTLHNASLIIDSPCSMKPYFKCCLISGEWFRSRCFGTHVKKVDPEKVVKFQEYSNFSDPPLSSPGKKPKTSRLRMGFLPYTIGLLYPPMPQNPSLFDLQDDCLKQTLLNGSTPEEYFKEHRLHFSYLKGQNTAESLTHYLLMMVAARGQAPVSSIDLICNTSVMFDTKPKFNPRLCTLTCNDLESIDKDTPVKEPPSFRDLLKQQGVAQILIFQKGATGFQLQEEIKIADEGILVRMYKAFPFSDDDFSQLVALSSAPVGCTGDLSFSKTFSAEIIPFYPAPRHKNHVIKHLLKLYEDVNEQNKNTQLWKFLTFQAELAEFDSLDSEFRARKKYGTHDVTREQVRAVRMALAVEAGELLQNHQVHLEWRAFCQYLKTHYCFKEVLTDSIARNLNLRSAPSLREIEKAILSQFSAGSIDLKQAHDKMQEAIGSL